MDELQKLAYESTLQRLREAFPDTPSPFVSQIAKYLRCHPTRLTRHKSFRDLTVGDRRKSMTLENLALWQCKFTKGA